jgi:hypothetical protein
MYKKEAILSRLSWSKQDDEVVGAYCAVVVGNRYR